MTTECRGNKVEWCEIEQIWVYVSDGVPFESDRFRKCTHCQQFPLENGHDACLGTLIGVKNACCGHGNFKHAYIQFLDGECLYGEEAIIVLEVLRKHKKIEED